VKGLLTANVVAAAATIIWLLIFAGVANHYAAMPGYGYSGAWDAGVYIPMGISLGLLATIVTFNFVKRCPTALAFIAIVSMLALFPFAIVAGGGV
jgi:riboflavin transporter FmnP